MHHSGMRIEPINSGSHGNTVPPQLRLLGERIQQLCDLPEGYRGLKMRVGLACGQGKMRQIVHIDSVLEAIHLFEALRVIGYEPEDGAKPNTGVDRLYRRTSDSFQGE